jgi:translation initiation factor IF-2
MRTIASLAERLDMSAERALETLRMLQVPVDGVDSEISDEQCDILMDVDEDPSTLDAKLRELEKKEEAKRKKTERLLKGAKTAAAAKKKTVSKAAEIIEEEPEPELQAADVEAEEAEPVAAIADIVEPEPEAEPAAPQEVAEVAPEAEPDVVEAPVEEPAPAMEETPDAEEVPMVESPVAEVVLAEILPPEPEAEDPEARELRHALHAHEHGHPPMGALAEAELRHKVEDERRKRKEKEQRERPLPVPDPAVVAEVIRRAQEREAEKNRKLNERKTGGVRPPAPLANKPFVDAGDLTLGRPGAPKGPKEKAPPPKPLSPKAAKKKQKRTDKARVMDEHMRREAAAAVRGITSGFGPGKKKRRRKDGEGDMDGDLHEIQGGTIEVEESMTVEELARAMGLEVSDIILELMEDNILATKNQRLEIDLIRRVAARHNFDVETVIPEEGDALAEEEDRPEDILLRAPVVTVMGHVDHGKTSLLDVVREANVVAGEAGGITQHIAAYDVKLASGRVVFLDTPGHAAFTQMRARGAQVTDLVILVVAADDGVKPQTIEAIDHAKAAGVKIIVAINKCDKPDAEPDRVRQELTQFGLVDEQWGGETFMKNISCHTREGIEELMDMIVLTAQMMDLKGNPKKRARGAVVESEILRGQGPVAWVLVQNGTLKPGDIFLCGTTSGRVRNIISSRGEHLQEAGPATPVLVTGFSAPPDAGDQFVVLTDERIARSISEKRLGLARQRKGPAVKHMTLEDFHERMAGAEKKTLNIIIKADVQGSVDVLHTSFAKQGNDEVSISVVHSGVGAVNESDVMLASASDAVIIGFHVTASAKIAKLADDEGVEVRTYKIIYEAIEEVRNALEGMLTPDSQLVVTGHAEIRAIFKSSALGNIAGCIQQDGETVRGGRARVMRDGTVIHDGVIGTLRRGKDDARTVAAGYECGIKLDRYDDVAVGDIIESYRMESVAKKL